MGKRHCVRNKPILAPKQKLLDLWFIPLNRLVAFICWICVAKHQSEMTKLKGTKKSNLW